MRKQNRHLYFSKAFSKAPDAPTLSPATGERCQKAEILEAEMKVQ